MDQAKKTVSVLNQLNRKDISFIDSAIPYTADPGFSFFEIHAPLVNSYIYVNGVFMGLVYKRVDGDEFTKTFNFNPLFSSNFKNLFLKEVNFDEWWSKIVYEDRKNGFNLTREKLILSIAEKDGFAHLDPQLNPEYEKFLQADSLELILNGEKVLFNNSAVKSSVRQIGFEVLLTLERNFEF